MKAYLKGYYGCKNFGDELLLLGVLRWIFDNYSIEELVVEAGDDKWLKFRLDNNANIVLKENEVQKLSTVPIKQHDSKRITHIKNILGKGKYKNYFKFFGGGEVLTDDRSFPHDGRNLVFLYNYSIRHQNFALLGGIGNIRKKITNYLYKFVVSNAQKIVVRERFSYEVVLNFLRKHKKPIDNVVLHHDFSLDVINNCKPELESQKTSLESFLKSLDVNGDYILLNINSHIFNKHSLNKIEQFCNTYAGCQKIYFPCDMYDDVSFYDELKKFIPDLFFYDWTKFSLLETLYIMAKAKAGLGARLHFLYPLKVFGVTLEPLVYKDKVRKLIVEE